MAPPLIHSVSTAEAPPATLAEEILYRVLVVGAQAQLRSNLISALAHEANLACCGECESIAETRQVVGKLAPDLVLLDLRMPDGESFELIGWLNQRFPCVPVLVTSDQESPAAVMRALSAGASGYLARSNAINPVVQAIQAVLRGERFVDGGFEVLAPETLMQNVNGAAVLRDGI